MKVKTLRRKKERGRRKEEKVEHSLPLKLQLNEPTLLSERINCHSWRIPSDLAAEFVVWWWWCRLHFDNSILLLLLSSLLLLLMFYSTFFSFERAHHGGLSCNFEKPNLL